MGAPRAGVAFPMFRYHVYLSYNAREDTRYNFSDHLYWALVKEGLAVFRGGEDDGRRVDRVKIMESKMSIVVISKNYGSSIRCLEELVEILKRDKDVLPVFYRVDPSDVQAWAWSFDDAFFRQHGERFKYEEEEDGRVERWRAALRQVAGMPGKTVKADSYESSFIQDEIMKDVRKKVGRKRSGTGAAHILVGREFDIERINSWVQDGSDNNIGIATIYGASGIGKTTIAKMVYNINAHTFEASSFLSVQEELSEPPDDAKLHLQRKLVSDLLKRKATKIRSVGQGSIMIKQAMYGKRVLLILDDADQLDHFEQIFGVSEWYAPGSKVIITAKTQPFVTETTLNSQMFHIQKLDTDESLTLFCWHAFGQYRPMCGYKDWPQVAVRHCCGVPLALQVFGSSLFGESIYVWEDRLEKLKSAPHSDIGAILGISFDCLDDDHDKSLLCDIACFFIGMDSTYVVDVLESCGFFAAVGIQNLMDRCLLTISQQNRVMMHELVRYNGIVIVYGESPDNTGDRKSRLWDSNDMIGLLGEDTQGKSLIYRSWKPRLVPSAHSTKAFSKLHNLQLLNLDNVCILGCFDDIPGTVVWLHWRQFPLAHIPNNVSLEKLVVLEMQGSSLRYAWKESRSFDQLRILDLSHSQYLIGTPRFTDVPRLEVLALKNCIRLTEVDESIGDLKCLKTLNLGGCRRLEKLPQNLNMVRSLEELNISLCLKLRDLPKVPNKFESLKLLKANGTVFNNLVSSFSLLTPQSLVKLSLADCGLSRIPNDFSCFPLLEELNLASNPITSLLDVKGLTTLKYLTLTACERLESIPELPTSLLLDVEECKSLKVIRNNPELLKSPIFRLHSCEKLVEAGGLFKVEPIRNMNRVLFHHLGLSDFECLGTSELYNIYTDSKMMTDDIQVLHECGIHSVFLPRSDVPNWFRCQDGDSIACVVSGDVGHEHNLLRICIKYCLRDGGVPIFPENFTLDINNRTKGLRWKYEPTIYGIPKAKEDILWLSCWTVGDLIKLEDGDQLQISASIMNFHVKQCAFHLMFGEVGTETTVSDIEKTASDKRKMTDPPSTSTSIKKRKTTYFLDHRPFIARRGSSSVRIHMGGRDSTASQILLQHEPQITREIVEQASSSTSQQLHYEVFLSFRGSDTGLSFIDKLYMELVRGGYSVFRDDEEILSGQSISSGIQKAIGESEISIVVFSENYASSRWCLDELVKIMKHRIHRRLSVLPVFYHVRPSDVMHQTGSFADSFSRHEEVFKEEMERVVEWREALRFVASLSGIVVEQNCDESKIIQNLAKEVSSYISRSSQNIVEEVFRHMSQ